MDKQRIINAVRDGLSYAEVAEKFGITRSSVAGICYRAGVKVGPRPEKRSASASVAQKRAWANPEIRKRRLEAPNVRNKEWLARMSAEERSQHAMKGWRTRRLKTRRPALGGTESRA